jgi:hypothetical protein
VSVVVGAGTRVDLPVSCVEAGRWNGGRSLGRSRSFASRRVRRAKQATVERNVRHHADKRSDQGLVWSAIDHELTRLGAGNATSALVVADATLDHDSRVAAAAQELVELVPLPGQVGVVVAHGRRVVVAEVFATPELLAAAWEPLVRAALLDAPEQVEGHPSATRALRFLRRFATSRSTEADGVGLGREHHVRTDRLVGQALVLDGGLVHASAFALAA